MQLNEFLPVYHLIVTNTVYEVYLLVDVDCARRVGVVVILLALFKFS